MGPMVVVLASPKQLKVLLRENGDIGIYAHEIPVKQLSKWPLDKVNVWTESPDVFYDLMVCIETKSVTSSFCLDRYLKCEVSSCRPISSISMENTSAIFISLQTMTRVRIKK